jgi:hypothetical protein
MRGNRKIYTGIGSRTVPDKYKERIITIAKLLNTKGYTLRSGGADGSDTIFESVHSGKKEIYIPWKGFNNSDSELYTQPQATKEISSKAHPAYFNLKEPVQKLMDRNVLQVLGSDLKTPSDFVICYTPDGCESSKTRSSKTGGTGLAITVASNRNIPVFNVFNDTSYDKLVKYLTKDNTKKPEKKIVGREAKFIQHLFEIPGVRPDTHIVKETIHYEDGTTEPNLRIIPNFKRPFWITKPHMQNHNEKKESEYLENVNKYYATQSALGKEVAMRLGGKYIGRTALRDVQDSPYVYGLDVDSKTAIKKMYMDKYPDLNSAYELAVLDIESNTETDEMVILSLTTRKKIFTTILSDILPNKREVDKQLKYLYDKHIPRTHRLVFNGDHKKEIKNLDILKGLDSNVVAEITNVDYDKKQKVTKVDCVIIGKHKFETNENVDIVKLPIISQEEISVAKDIEIEYAICDSELEMLRKTMAKAHEWQPDFIAVWNIEFDVPFMLKVCDKYAIEPKDIFCDPRLPENLRHFEYKRGSKQRVTESGVVKPINPEEQWHIVKSAASFYWIDAMSAHRYIRVGGKSVPGGYSLDNILTQELGAKLKKLKFKELSKAGIIEGSIDWHKFMLNNHPLEYTIYNQWDTISVLELDAYTKDLSHSLPMLAGVSSFDIFNSGPKRIIDAMHFFYLENGRVLGSKQSRIDADKLLGLDNWIVLLPSSRIKQNGMCVIEESPNLHTNMRGHTYDADQVSGYPSNTQAANVSKETTVREIISIEGFEKDDFKLQNINLLFGVVNTGEYVHAMFNFPEFDELAKKIREAA